VLEKRKGKSSEEFDDFLQVLIESKYKDGSDLTISEVTGILMAVLLGGQHTSNVTGAWLMMHLLNEPRWLARVMAEQDAVLGAGFKGFATYEQVSSMKVLQKCLDETLRLHPPFFQVARRVQEDVVYKGTVIPQGRLVCISPGAVMRLDSLFERPVEFDPDRFDKEPAQHAFIPFGGGRHICTGLTLCRGLVYSLTALQGESLL
jgi:sterol 14-demethylase